MANHARPSAKTSVRTWPASESRAKEWDRSPPASSMTRIARVRTRDSRRLVQPCTLLGFVRVGQVRGCQNAGPDGQRSRAEHLASASNHDLSRAAAKVDQRPLAADGVPAGRAEEAEGCLTARGDGADRDAEHGARLTDEGRAVRRLPDSLG